MLTIIDGVTIAVVKPNQENSLSVEDVALNFAGLKTNISEYQMKFLKRYLSIRMAAKNQTIDNPTMERLSSLKAILLVLMCHDKLTANEQGFAMLGDLKNVKPGTAAD